MIFISLWTPTITVTRTRSIHHEYIALMTIMIVSLFASGVAAFQHQLHPLQTTVTGMPKQQTAPKLQFLHMSTDDEVSPSPNSDILKMATPKKFINDAESSVEEFIQGLLLTYPNRLQRLENHDVILANPLPKSTQKVCILSGGGSGHEPSHAGWIGNGMLTGAVCGGVSF